jgi:hypothetical protein
MPPFTAVVAELQLGGEWQVTLEAASCEETGS